MNKNSFRILVVDDDEIAREVVSSILTKEGYAVTAAVDGLDAISVLRREEVHFIITDLRMPGADGLEVLKYAVRTNPGVAVVILTAYGTLDTTLEAIKEGAYDYLTKPFKGQEIIFVADRAFERSLLVRENQELRRHLRDTHRDLDLLNKVVERQDPFMTRAWRDRVERLNAMDVLGEEDTEILKERLIGRDGKGQGINR